MSDTDRNGTHADGPHAGNGDGHATDDPLARRADATIGGNEPEPFAVEDADEPANPDEATRANVDAARAALRARGGRSRAPRGPMGTIALVVIICCTMAMLVYGLVTFSRIKTDGDVTRLRQLELQEYVSVRQQKYRELTGLVPPGQLHQPLTHGQRDQLAELRAAHGSLFKPAEDAEAAEIDKFLAIEAGRASAAATRPATRPASPDEEKSELYRLEQQAYLAERLAQFRKLSDESPGILFHPPLSGDEAARLAALRQKHGPQYKPAEDDDAVRIEQKIREAATTRPATGPAAASGG